MISGDTFHNSDDGAIDRSLRLIQYLQEFVSLRTRIIRDIQTYQHVLWLHEIPHEKGCFTQSWGANEEIDTDLWLEVQKTNEPICPRVPEICEPWLNQNSLVNAQGTPELFSAITVPLEQEDSEENSQNLTHEKRNLEDFPEIQEKWEKYVEDQWLPWKDQHNKWHSIQEIYNRLFAIHQDQQRLGEEYELVLGLGLLMWHTPSGHIVRRHLITAKALLEFEAKLGKFTVTPEPDGAKLTIELDMLDASEQPFNVQRGASDNLRSSGDNPWDRSSIDPVLHSLAKAIGSLGEYHSEQQKPTHYNTQDKPLVVFAPALVLRKRSQKGIQEILGKMHAQISEGKIIPAEFLDLAEGTGTRNSNTVHKIQENSARISKTETPIFFPKLANEKQRQIIKTIDSKNGVLVQGPPGTGKSHTIANLICHLLATGKRILVTAQTPRALEVLNRHLPEPIRPLCISLLGGGSEEQKALKSSVEGILSREATWQESDASGEISCLSKKLNTLRQDKAKITFRLRSIREADTQPQVILNGAYQGTSANIAKQLKLETESHNWFTDLIRYDQEMPFSSEELEQLRESLVAITPELKTSLSLQFSLSNVHLPSPEHIQKLINQESDSKRQLDLNPEFLEPSISQVFTRVEPEQLESIIKEIESLIFAVRSIQIRPMPWINSAIQDILSDNDRPWKELHQTTHKILKGLRERARLVDRQEVEAPSDIDRKILLSNAIALKQYFEDGGKLSRLWCLNDKIVKKNALLIKDVRIDGRPCDSTNSLKMLVEFLKVEYDLKYCWGLWEGKAERSETSVLLQVTQLEECLEALTTVVSLYEILEKAKTSIQQIPGIDVPRWHDTHSLEKYLETCKLVDANNRTHRIQREFQQIFDAIQPFIQTENAHPLIHTILYSLQNRDVTSYKKSLLQLSELEQWSKRANSAEATLGDLSKFAPQFAMNFKQTCHDESWKNRIKTLAKTWTWARANSWLHDFLNSDDIPSLQRRIKQIEEQEIEILTRLTELQAWKFCFARLKEEQRRHLVGWQQAIKKLGKGTGKGAYKHRRDAQWQLNKCREAVPAWVMPLHKLWETIDPMPEMFDVIIVDEASQCGVDSLPLMFLGKKQLIVGDDQQISPESGFIKQESIARLQQQYLYDFDHADSFDNLSSLFDHGKRRFGTKITLREHFRCMPEIIRFSNDLCYHDTPLIPLRQYPPDRLKPLEVVHVPGGHREGENARTINRPEAEELTHQVIQCCEDPRYEAKTMGVIVLQGEAQAELIRNMLQKELGAEEMEKRKLICGNPYHFQGDERDIVFLSMVAAPNKRIGPLTKDTDKKRFNVAVSRAKDQMWLFHTASVNDLSEKCFRKRLLQYFQNPKSQISHALGTEADELFKISYQANRQMERPPRPFDSWFELDVCLSIAQEGYRVIPQYPIAGNFIDLVIEGEKSQLAVECDGDYWHGPEQFERDMERQRKLEQQKWKFHRIRESIYYATPQTALEGLWKDLTQYNIFPVKLEQSFSEYSDDYNIVLQKGPDKEETDSVSPTTQPTPNPTSKGQPDNIAKDISAKKPNPILQDFYRGDEDQAQSNTSESPQKADEKLKPIKQQYPYVHWQPTILPDPRTASIDQIIDSLMAIISAEGPMVCHRAYFLYARAVEPPIMRVGRQIRSIFNEAIKKALKEQKIDCCDEQKPKEDVFNWIVRRSGTEPVWIRTRGERDFSEIPSAELGTFMSHLYTQNPTQGTENLFQEVLTCYNIRRFTSNIKGRLSQIHLKYVNSKNSGG